MTPRADRLACPFVLAPAGTTGEASTLSLRKNAGGRMRRTKMMRCSVAVAALVVSGGLALAQTREMPGLVAPSAQQDTPPVVAPQSQPRLDAEGYNMEKPAPPGTMGPVKKNPDPTAASTPDLGDAANPTATTGQAPTRSGK
jgi:hypothetical protein